MKRLRQELLMCASRGARIAGAQADARVRAAATPLGMKAGVQRAWGEWLSQAQVGS